MLTLSTRLARWLNVVLITTLLSSLLPPPLISFSRSNGQIFHDTGV